MTTIGLVANDELLAVTLNPKLTSGDQNTVDVQVDFSDDWEGFAKSAVFFTANDTNTIYEKVMINGECIVPAEVMVERGVLYIGIRGVNSEKNEVKTTSLVKLKISEGTPTGNSTEVEPTPDVYQQLLSAYGKTDDAIEKEKAERQAEIAVERARIDNILTLGGLPASEYELEISSEIPNGTTAIAKLVTNGYTANIEISDFSIPALDSDTDIIFRFCDIPLEFKPLYANPYGLYREKHTSYDAVDFTYDEFGNTGHLMCEVKVNYSVTIKKIVISYPLKNPMTPAELQDIRTGYDGRIYTSAGDAVRAKVDKSGKNQVTKYNSEFYIKTANIRDRSRQIYGRRLDTITGDLINDPNMVISQFFEVDDNTQIGLTDFDDKGTTFVKFFFYDEQKALISHIEVNSSSGVANIPETAAFVRYQTYIVYDGRKITITMPYTTEYIKPYVFEEMPIINEQFSDLKNGNFKDGTIEPIKTAFFDTVINLIDQSKVVTGAIMNNTGVLETLFTTWTATDYIPVVAGKKYYYSNNGTLITAFTGALYDKNKKYLQSIGNTCPFTPTQDGYCRISSESWSETRQLQVDKLTDFVPYDEPKSTIKEKYLPDYIGKNQNYLDKKVLILGDSITHLDTSTSGWVKYFMQIVQPAVKVNLAVDGATWKDKVDNQVYDGNPKPSTTGNCIGNQVQKVINEKANGNIDYDDFDVIIIAAGTNDAFNINPDSETIDDVESQFISAYGTQGTFSIVPLDSVNRRTFSGIIRYTYQKLNELYPNAKFCICSPLQEVYENYVSTYKKGELFRYIASRLSVHYFNTRDCGICNLYESPVKSTVKRDLADGIHTNASGAEKLGKFIAKEFIKLYL